MIRRVLSSKDKRRYELHSTNSGERMLTDLGQIVARHEAEFFAPLSVEERQSLRRTLAQLIS